MNLKVKDFTYVSIRVNRLIELLGKYRKENKHLKIDICDVDKIA